MPQVAQRNPVRHCWVAPVGGASSPHPGLVLEWRRVEGRYEARVTYVVDDPATGEVVQVTQWLARSVLRPAGGDA